MNFKSFLFCLSLVVFTSSCKEGVVVDAPEQSIKDVQENEFPVILDTMPNLVTKQYGYKDILDARYEPFYFGQLSDTIILGKSYRNFPLPPHLGGSDFDEFFNPYGDYFISFANNMSEINNILESDSSVLLEILVNNRSVVKECYPVYLKNKSKTPIILGDDLLGVEILMQARNEDGKWQDIEKRFNVMCGNGMSAIVLPPNECVVLLAPIYKGNFVTPLRMKCRDFYSKPFMGTINKSQFVIPD